MSQGKRSHLSYERVVLLADSAPAFRVAANHPTTTPRVISRVQDISYSFDYGGLQVKEIGSSEYIKDRTPASATAPMKSRIPIITQPTVNVEFSYLFFDAQNEENLGLNVDGGYLFEYTVGSYSKLYNKPDWSNLGATAEAKKGDINLYLLAQQTSERKDVVGVDNFSGNLDLIGIGNCYLSSYGISASVGSMVSCQASYNCSNICLDEYGFDALHKDVPIPAVDNKGVRSESLVSIPKSTLQAAALDTDNSSSSLALRPGDIEIKWTNNKQNSEGGFNMIDLNPEEISVESFEIDLSIERQDINAFGSDYIKDRKIQFPILGQLNVGFFFRDLEKHTDGKEISKIFKDDVSMDLEIKLYSRTSLTEKVLYATINVPDAKLLSESHNMTIGDFGKVAANFAFEAGLNSGMKIIKA